MLGSLNGNFESAFKKLATLHAKQNFTFAIITGNLFSAEQDKDALSRLLSGQVNVPLSTYFTVGTNPLPEQVIELVEKDEDVSSGLCYALSITQIHPVVPSLGANVTPSDLRESSLSREAQCH